MTPYALLRFHNKDLLVSTLPDGRQQPFFRQAPFPGSDPSEGKWQPLDALTYNKQTQVPIAADTKRFWNHHEPGFVPGYGNKSLQEHGQYLDNLKLPSPKQEITDPLLANEFLGTEAALETREALIDLDHFFKQTDQLPLQEQVNKGLKIQRTKKKKPETDPKRASYLRELLQNAIDLAEAKANGLREAFVSSRVIIAILVINPLLNLQEAKAQENPKSQQKVEAAYDRLQKMNGSQLKALLTTLPEEHREQLLDLLPKRLTPSLMSKQAMAKSVEMIPEGAIKKGFDKITEEEFESAAENLHPTIQENLLKLLLEATQAKTKSQQIPKKEEMEIA